MNNFTPRALKALALARDEAGRLKHNYVGTEHLLLGLIAVGQGTGIGVLQKMGVVLEDLRSDLELKISSGSETKPAAITFYTPQYSSAIELAGKEAKALNHSYIGTEHFLLGLLRERDVIVAAVFDVRNLDIEKVRRAIVHEINPNADAEMAEVMSPIYTRDLLAEFKRTREELLNKFETIVGVLDSLKTEINQLRTDMLKGTS